MTPDWETEMFKFLRGTFQGDPYSCAIFLIVFNPLIQYIKLQSERTGYRLETQQQQQFISTTPFADDFNIVSRNKIQHQKFITDVEEKATSMGLQFKPSKCCSLSIQAGKSTNVTYHLTDQVTGVATDIISIRS